MSTMDLAIIDAAGHCGRVLAPTARLQRVGHRGGDSENALRGLRADLEDAFVEDAPTIDLALESGLVTAGIVVMLAGATVPTDPDKPFDRAPLARENYHLFRDYADARSRRAGAPPIVIVQSNPVELGVRIFAARLERQRARGRRLVGHVALSGRDRGRPWHPPKRSTR